MFDIWCSVMRTGTNLLRWITVAAMLIVLMPLCAVSQSGDAKPADSKPVNSYETFFLTNVSSQNDLNDIQTALRNMLPRAKIYGVPTQNAISVWATADDLALAKKMIAELDRPRKVFRLTYTVTQVVNGKKTGSERFALLVTAGDHTQFRQGTRVPIITGSYDTGTMTSNSQVQYLDVGIGIDADLEVYADGVRLKTKVEQSSVSDEKSGLGVQDPVIRQTRLESTATLAMGKPMALGALDIPGTDRHEDVEVVAESVK
jgi:type II secretory pathway component GspD/PulD (secretin)